MYMLSIPSPIGPPVPAANPGAGRPGGGEVPGGAGDGEDDSLPAHQCPSCSVSGKVRQKGGGRT